MGDELMAALAARRLAPLMPIREASALAAAQTAQARAPPPPEDAASSFAEDAPIGDSASMAGGEACDGEAGEVPRECAALLRGGRRTPRAR